ncbi:hypothetical protein EFM34_05990 [Leuconostoc suionicum]|uniref:hypothetical protein n=1 Tax=Leuconostoc suionicum TaxID=1511761 RepID=UPI0021A9C256|nr:hypothetical protein [Leuconostoc suionicum]MCT4382781.1 hypothetical protein [Leuconostoc suionicum]
MEIINEQANKSYSNYKIFTVLALGISYFVLIYVFNTSNIFNMFITIGINILTLFLIKKQRFFYHEVTRPLLFNDFKAETSAEFDEEEYVKDLSTYTKEVLLCINVEMVLVILNLLFVLLGIMDEKLFTRTMTNHPAIPITLVVTGIVYALSIESDIDYLYLKYFKKNYLEYMKNFY